MGTPRLEAFGICKSFGPTRALNKASLVVQPGEVHGLIGENGAGKSTLMKILSGACSGDKGEFKLDGESLRLKNPLHARDLGIAMIYQELNLAPSLSVAENVLLGLEPARFGWMKRREMERRAAAALEELGAGTIHPETLVRRLTIAQKQLVEIARALVSEPRVVIMDEPTSSLTHANIEHLFAVVRRLRDRGVSVIYISHFLEECQAVCDRYTVLRDGQTVGSGVMAEVSLDQIVRLMVGREVKDIYDIPAHEAGECVFQISGLRGIDKPRDVSLDLHAGEIFGLAGLVGAGRTETLRAIFGLDRCREGFIICHGRSVKKRAHPHNRLRDGIGMLSENRKEEGLLLNRSVADNLTLSDFRPLSRYGWISNEAQNAAAAHWIIELGVKTSGPEQVMGDLSGGNQQKVAIARLLHHGTEVLLLDEPTRGIDVASKQQIYQLIGSLAADGKAILFVSSYLPELLGICDTIGVMCRGHLTAVKPANAWTEHAIMLAATGAHESSPVSAHDS